MEKLHNRCPLKFNEGKHRMGSHYATHQSGLEAKHLESSFVKKDLEPWRAPLEK